ncbi:MAG: hypothetical protein PHG68_05120, partial [Candidatus Omnitrophica bacterium]|nr:hypothetical protein [Candidatus Omnitrophota bacterium]
RCFIPSPSPLVRREVFDNLGAFCEDIAPCEDWEMWMRIAAKYKVGFVNEPLARYRLHRDNLERRMDVLAAYGSIFRAIEKAVDFAPQFYNPFKQRSIAEFSFCAGRVLLLHGRQQEARGYFKKAAKCRFTALRGLPFLALSYLNKTCLDNIVNYYRLMKKSAVIKES